MQLLKVTCENGIDLFINIERIEAIQPRTDASGSRIFVTGEAIEAAYLVREHHLVLIERMGVKVL
jgi:hypothetical protein